MMIEEQKPNNSTESAILPMQCYVHPFWKHSGLEIYNESNLDTMSRMPDNCIDLTVTSPPYDGLRNYNGYSFSFEDIAKELYRVTKDGGVVVWVVGDATVKGSETLTSFRQALYFKEIGFNVHDTMIYEKANPAPQLFHNRYQNKFEYMFILSKGQPKTCNPIKIPVETTRNSLAFCGTRNSKNQVARKKSFKRTNTEKVKGNIWKYNVGNLTEIWNNSKHPAIFPEQLANDHIISWSNEGDVIYDPFAGSGTTGKMALLNKRKCIMSEISAEYCELSKERLSEYLPKGLFA